jgi:hypothetical protein
MTTQLIDITARNFDKISYKDYIALSNKRHDNYCSIYCDKYGCTHKSYLKSYFKYVQALDPPLHNFVDYRNINLIVYLLLIPLLIYTTLFLIIKK